MRLRLRFSLRMLLLLVTLAAVATLVMLNWRNWYANYLDWSASRAIRARAEKIFREETGTPPPRELVNILGSGDMSHWGPVYDIGLTPDQIVSCGFDKSVRCWSTESGELLEVINDGYGYVADHSSLVVTVDDQDEARVYETSSTPLKLLKQFSVAGESSALTEYTSNLAAALVVIYTDQPQDVVLYDLTTGTKLSTLHLPQEAKDIRLGFHENGRVLAACKNKFLLFDSANGSVVGQWKNEPWPFDHQSIRSIVRLRSPWWMIVGASTNIVWNEESHEWKNIDLNLGGTPDLVLPESRDRAWIVNSGIMTYVSMERDELRNRFARTTPFMQVMCMALRTYGGGGTFFTHRAIGYGYPTGQVALLDELGRVRLPREMTDHVTAVAWNRTSDLLAIGTSTGDVVLLRPGSWSELQRFSVHGGGITHVEFSPDGAALLVEESQEIAVFDWRTAKPLVRRPRQVSVSRDATLASGQGQLLAYVLNEGWTLFDYTTSTRIAQSGSKVQSPQPFAPYGVTWSPNEQCFVFITETKGKKGFCRIRLVGHDTPAGLSLQVTEQASQESGWLYDVSASDSIALLMEARKPLIIWNWRTSQHQQIDPQTKDGFQFVALGPSARQVAAVIDSDLVLYSAAGKELYRHRIGPTRMMVSGLSFSPDGRYIAVLNGNGTCYVLKNPAPDSHD